MKLNQLIEKAKQRPNKVVAIAAAHDKEVISAVEMALKEDIASFHLFGNKKKIISLLDVTNSYDNSKLIITDTENDTEAASLAVRTVREGKAQVLMKGMISTASILKEVLNKEYGLRGETILSHVAAFEVPGYHRLLFVTDAAMNISPNLKQKADIITNAVNIARQIGVEKPKVAPICAVEVINPDMEATLDAAALAQMQMRGQLKHCLVDGPLGLDNAISAEAASHKGITSEVAGKADILLVPTIEVGNTLYKALIYFAKAKVGAVIAGAKAPIVLTSRADTAESKLYSIALAVQATK